MRPTGATRGRINCGSTLITINKNTNKMNYKRLQKLGLVRDLNPGPRAPEARIIPLDQQAAFPKVTASMTQEIMVMPALS